MAAYEKVPRGIFWGFTLAELDENFAKYKQAVKDQIGVGQIIAAAQNGKSAQYSIGGRSIGLSEWGHLLREAYFYVSDNPPEFLPSRISVPVFR